MAEPKMIQCIQCKYRNEVTAWAEINPPTPAQIEEWKKNADAPKS